MNFSLDEAYVSFISDDAYASGATVLGRSLRNSKTKRRIVLLVTDGVSESVRFVFLSNVYLHISMSVCRCL